MTARSKESPVFRGFFVGTKLDLLDKRINRYNTGENRDLR